jgi:acetylornithine deacetylase
MIEDRGETFPAFETDPQHPGVAILVQAHRDVHGTVPQMRMSTGVCDAGWLAARGIPSIVYGPGSWEQAHAIDEYVSTADLLACARVYARVIDAWCA